MEPADSSPACAPESSVKATAGVTVAQVEEAEDAATSAPARLQEQPTAPQKAEADIGSGSLHAAVAARASQPEAWALDARKYGTVEEWFHSLVRAHFWGALKASSRVDFAVRPAGLEGCLQVAACHCLIHVHCRLGEWNYLRWTVRVYTSNCICASCYFRGRQRRGGGPGASLREGLPCVGVRRRTWAPVM